MQHPRAVEKITLKHNHNISHIMLPISSPTDILLMLVQANMTCCENYCEH